MDKRFKCTISGSFRKFYSEIADYYNELSKKYEILSPKEFVITDDSTDFIRLKSDGSDSIREIEMSHLKAISEGDFLAVINPKNHLGVSTTLEIGFAIEKSIPVYFSDGVPKILENYQKTAGNICSFNKNVGYIADLNSRIAKVNKVKTEGNEPIVINNESEDLELSDLLRIGISIAQNKMVFCVKKPKDIMLSKLIETI